jgi:hypothetical protein
LRGRVVELESLLVEVSELLKAARKGKHEQESETENVTPCQRVGIEAKLKRSD